MVQYTRIMHVAVVDEVAVAAAVVEVAEAAVQGKHQPPLTTRPQSPCTTSSVSTSLSTDCQWQPSNRTLSTGEHVAVVAGAVGVIDGTTVVESAVRGAVEVEGMPSGWSRGRSG